MASFGEDLRTERLSRGVALEDITAITKISQRHLVALEQDRFRLLPGGILNKGIVRGYVGALGLDERDWTAFATNVGRARIQRHEAVELRMRWAGAVVLLVAVSVLGFFAVRYYGVRSHWWPSLLP